MRISAFNYSFLHRHGATLGIFAFAVLVSALAWQLALEQQHVNRVARFDRETAQAIALFRGRLRECENALRVAQCLFTANNPVEPDEWRSFVTGLNLERSYPAIKALGFIPAGTGQTEPAVRLIHPDPQDGARIFLDESRRQAMDLSRDTNTPILAGHIQFHPRSGQTSHPILYLPAYRKTATHETLAQRQSAIDGWIFASLQPDKLLTDVQNALAPGIDLSITDAPPPHPDTDRPYRDETDLASESVIAFGGRDWTLQLRATPQFSAGISETRPLQIIIGAITLNLALMGIFWSLSSTRAGAISQAEKTARTLRQSEDKARTLALIASRSDNAVILTSARGRVEWVNPEFTRLTGYNFDEVRGEKLSSLLREVDPQTNEMLRRQFRRGSVFQFEIANVSKEGHKYWASLKVQPLRDSQGKIVSYMILASDNTVRRRLEQFETDRRAIVEMIAQHKPLEETLVRILTLLQRHVPDSAASVMLLRDGELEHFGPELPEDFRTAITARAMRLAAGLCELGNGSEATVTNIAEDAVWQNLREAAAAANLAGCWSVPLTSGEGGVLGVLTVYCRNCRQPQGPEAEMLDMTAKVAAIAVEHRQLTDRLARRAQTDPLTGVPNRALLEDCLAQAITRAELHQQMVGLFFIDLDRFKLINDTLGHQAGDELLRQVCQRLQGSMRHTDTLVRMGGDEFTLILPELRDRQNAVMVAQKLLDAMRKPFDVAGHELFVCASIGIAVYPQDGADVATLQKNADTAMYRAKAAGGHTFQCFAPEMNATAREKLEMENQLRRAIEHGELQLHYQPQTDRLGRIVGVEALLRWNHPKMGMVSPAKFIPLAEESGLIVPIGAWVLNEACRQNKRWQDAGLTPVKVAVNVSAMQFARNDFLEIVSQAMAESGLESRWLELELTESLLMHNTTDTAEKLAKVREMGLGIAIDDFGTGYSSLAYLQRLPIDILKIDRSFVSELTAESMQQPGGNDTAIVRAIASMAHSLNMSVIAEGVETEEQRQCLLAIGCDMLQGYLISKPIPADRIDPLLRIAGKPADDSPPMALSA